MNMEVRAAKKRPTWIEILNRGRESNSRARYSTGGYRVAQITKVTCMRPFFYAGDLMRRARCLGQAEMRIVMLQI
jgi:hypothetical protein